MSKGSNRRPTDEGKYSESFDRIFGKKDKSKPRGERKEARLIKAMVFDELLTNEAP